MTNLLRILTNIVAENENKEKYIIQWQRSISETPPIKAYHASFAHKTLLELQ